MDASSAIERAARIVWKHRLLAALGILDVILTGSGLLSRALSDLLLQALFYSPELRGQLAPLAGMLSAPLVSIGQLGELYRLVSPYGTAGWVGLIGGAVVVLIALAVIGLVVEAGFIAVVGEVDPEKPVSLRGVFAAGWRRILPMVVIASIPAIPLTVGATLVVVAGTLMARGAGGVAALSSDPALAQQVAASVTLAGLAILCLPGLITLPLALLVVLAYRACILEGLGALASYRRAWQAVRARPGPVMILVVIGWVVSILANTVSFLPEQLTLIFLPAIALVWIIQGVARAYYLALWTCGWQALRPGEASSVSENQIDTGHVSIFCERPEQELNPRLSLRRAALYPLSYRGRIVK